MSTKENVSGKDKNNRFQTERIDMNNCDVESF